MAAGAVPEAVNGSPVGQEFPVNLNADSRQIQADIALDAAGNLVVARVTDGHGGSGEGVPTPWFEADFTSPTLELPLHSQTTGSRRSPSVSVDAAGDFVRPGE